MSRIEVFAVRYSIIFISLYIMLSTALSWIGISISYLRYFSGHSLVVDCLLLILSMNNNHYHCRFMMYLCMNSLFISILGLINDNYCIISDATTYLLITSITSILSYAITLYLCIKHFYNKRRNRYREYKIK